MHRAAFQGMDRVIEELLKSGVDVNAQDVEGRTPLMEACNAFKFDVIKQLVEAGADVNLQDARGCSALMRAAYGGYVDLVNYLLNHGADKEAVDNEGNKAIHYVREHCLAELKPILK